ncbi:Fungal Zn2-Cys6 binuclear cluster domain-containing protein [Cladophialophora immunda]|nr:Fungal Zn2-Cys6 binuclear cluster domain-containing protein [Cladophialophora immunda]
MSKLTSALRPGVYAPVLTPFIGEIQQEVDLPAFRAGVLRLAKLGVGLVLSGTLGEGNLLSRCERKVLVKNAREVLEESGLYRSVPIIAGAGAASLRETIEIVKDAADEGADAVIVVAPAYYAFVFGRDKATLKEFFVSVADASPVPVMLYNIPFATGGIDLDADFLIDISGVKLTCFNVSKGHRVALHIGSPEYRERHKLPFLVLAGSTDYLLPAIVARHHGCIGGPVNLYPKVCLRLFQLGTKALEVGSPEMFKEAQELQDLVTKADSYINRVGFLGIKSAMDIHVAAVTTTIMSVETSDCAPVKRPRGKYASQACIQCRQSKLKCSGQCPCQRCIQRGLSCQFSQEVEYVNLGPSNDNSQSISAGPSLSQWNQQSAPTSTTMEQRLIRLEGKVNALLYPQREGSARSDEAAESPFDVVEDCQGDTTFEAPLSALNANLESMKAQLGLQDWAPDRTPASSTRRDLTDSQTTGESIRGVRVGSQFLPFPSPADYQNYVDFFFEDINPCHSCVNESDFKHKNRNLARGAFARSDDICFLALNYIIFACADILRNVDPVQESTSAPCPGWKWFLASDALLRKRKLSGKADLCLIQFLIYEAFYLVHADRSSAAYSAIGIACRLCFQLGLHNEPRWGKDHSPYAVHMRQRVFWTVYFVDRRISLSCGRPYGIRDSDIRVDKPEWIYDKMLSTNSPPPSPDSETSAIMYLVCMISFGKLAGEVWDTMFSASVDGPSSEAIAILDAKIKHWKETTLPTIPLLPRHTSPTRRHLRQQLLVNTRISHLRLLLRRREMVSLKYSASTGLLCGTLATDIVEQIKAHSHEISEPSSFRFHLATTLGGAILILATLLCRDISEIGLKSQHTEYAESFHAAVGMLKELAQVLRAARRIFDDLESVLTSVRSILLRPRTSPQNDAANFTPSAFDDVFPYANPDLAHQDQFTENFGSQATAGGEIAPFNYDAFASLDSWDSYFQQPSSEYGVPWI